MVTCDAEVGGQTPDVLLYENPFVPDAQLRLRDKPGRDGIGDYVRPLLEQTCHFTQQIDLLH
jgi:hypothetical protein